MITRVRPVRRILLALMISISVLTILSTSVRATTHSTQDGLSFSEDGSGRVTSVSIGGIPIESGWLNASGGFYVRDNSGLPSIADNILDCGDFGVDETECNTCVAEAPAQTPWQKIVQLGTGAAVSCDTFQSTPVARFEVDEGQNSWGLIFQNVEIPDASPITHDLYCLRFEVATECGWRSKEHPYNRNKLLHSKHRVIASVEWFATEPGSEGVDEAKDPGAITITSIEAFNSTPELTPFALRTYRPTAATHARIKIVVDGFMPNDGRNPLSQKQNYAVVDNVSFFQVPDICQVVGEWDADEWVPLTDPVMDPLYLDMKLSVTDHDHYILFEGELKNSALDPVETRAIDFGFSLPIFSETSGDIQRVDWWNDNHNALPVRADELEMTMPFRVVGPADLRLLAGTDFVYPAGEKTFVEQTHRHRGMNISAYPFSSISITRSGNTAGLGIGDNLEADFVSISHFGYRVEQSGLAFLGRYYVEFNLGLLDRYHAPGQDTVPFSFILFRSDIPYWSEPSNFREATEKYQSQIFPAHFTRPTNCDDDWLFGGGQFKGEPPDANDEEGYHHQPNDFGFRYSQQKLLDTATNNTLVINGLNTWQNIEFQDIDVLAYHHPWAADFENEHDAVEVSGIMNVHAEQETRTQNHDPGAWDLGALWENLYQVQLASKCLLPGTVPLTLFTRDLSIEEDTATGYSRYAFPVLLTDQSFGGSDLISAELAFIDDAYIDVSIQSDTDTGMAGMFYDNIFHGQSKGPHLDILNGSPLSYQRYRDFQATGDPLAYSHSHFLPAISQLPRNVKFLKAAKSLLTAIDGKRELNFGGGTATSSNTQDELLTGNFNSRDFDGSKYGIIQADAGVFESSTVLDFNRDAQAFDFRRTLARQKNMTRLFNDFPCIENMPLEYGHCQEWDDFWGHGGIESMYRQIINESIWMSLAWGFHPSIQNLLPDNDKLPVNDQTGARLDYFIENHVRGIFIGPSGYTEISRQLHLAGWTPVTNAVAHDGDEVLPLFVERFGPVREAGGSSSNYFTVLNNDELKFTLAQLNDDVPKTPPPTALFEDLPDLQTLNDTSKCSEVIDCSTYPGLSAASDYFLALDKTFYLDIYDPAGLGLWNGNLHGRQLVDNPDLADIIAWPEILPDEFDESPSPDALYSIKRQSYPEQKLVIGGYRPNPLQQDSIPIDDKALMVFKLWTSLIVDNGPMGGEGERTGDSSSSDDTLVSAYYERYGRNWQRVTTDLGYGGSVDLAPAEDAESSVLYKFTIGHGGSYRVLAHLPVTDAPPAAARYEAYVVDYFEGQAGTTPLGAPVWSTVVDPADSETYNSGSEEGGFIDLSTLDIDLVEPSLVTVVIRLGAAFPSSGWLLADAVKLEPVEEAVE